MVAAAGMAMVAAGLVAAAAQLQQQRRLWGVWQGNTQHGKRMHEFYQMFNRRWRPVSFGGGLLVRNFFCSSLLCLRVFVVSASSQQHTWRASRAKKEFRSEDTYPAAGGLIHLGANPPFIKPRRIGEQTGVQ